MSGTYVKVCEPIVDIDIAAAEIAVNTDDLEAEIGAAVAAPDSFSVSGRLRTLSDTLADKVIKTASIAPDTATTTNLVTGVANKKICVTSLTLSPSLGANNISVVETTAGTVIDRAIFDAAQTSQPGVFKSYPFPFKTTAGNGISVITSGAVLAWITIQYYEEV